MLQIHDMNPLWVIMNNLHQHWVGVFHHSLGRHHQNQQVSHQKFNDREPKIWLGHNRRQQWVQSPIECSAGETIQLELWWLLAHEISEDHLNLTRSPKYPCNQCNHSGWSSQKKNGVPTSFFYTRRAGHHYRLHRQTFGVQPRNPRNPSRISSCSAAQELEAEMEVSWTEGTFISSTLVGFSMK